MTYPITPDPGIHQAPKMQNNRKDLTPVVSDQIQAWSKNLIHAIVAQIVSVLTFGLLKPDKIKNGLDALQNWWFTHTDNLKHRPHLLIGNIRDVTIDGEYTVWDATLDALYAKDFADGLLLSGANILVNPGFEKGLFAQGVGTYSQAYAHTGSRSLKLVGDGTNVKRYFFNSDDSRIGYIPISGGDIFYGEVWVRGDDGNSQPNSTEVGIRMVFEPYEKTTLISDYVQAFSLKPGVALSAGWTKIFGYALMPQNATHIKVSLQLTGMVADNEAYYFDDAIVREVTLAYGANSKADQALNYSTQNGELVMDVVTAGSNIVKNSGFERGLFLQGAGTVTNDEAHSGEKSLRIISNGSPKKYYLNTDDTNALNYMPAAEGDVFYCEMWVKGKSTNTQTSGGTGGLRIVFEPKSRLGANLQDCYIGYLASNALNDDWFKVSGYVTMPPNTAKVKMSIQLTAAVANNEVYYFDDVIVREVTIAAGANANANTANTNASLALSNAQQANDLYAETLTVGSNIVKNPSFEKGLFTQGAGVFTNDQARTGSRSLRISANGLSTKQYFLNSDEGSALAMPVSPGDVFYVEMWVYGKDTNAQTVGGEGGVRIVFKPTTTAGVDLDDCYVGYLASTSLNGVWTKVNGYITMPENAARAKMSIQVTNAVLNNEVYYFDDIVVREVTLASAANANANTAKANADTALVNAQSASDFAGDIVSKGTNLVTNGDFEKGVSSQPLVGTLSNDFAYSGSKSLKLVANGNTKTFYLLFDGASPRTIPVAAGDVFYCEMWVYGSSVGTGGAISDGLRILFEPTSKLGGNLPDCYVGATVSTALNGTWTKVSAYVTMPADAVKTKVAIQLRDTVTSGTVYVDSVIVREITLAKAAQDNVQATVDGVNQAVSGDTAGTGNAPSSVKGKLRLAWANIWDGHNGSSGSTDKLPTDIATAASSVRATANTAQSTANTATTTAQSASSLASDIIDRGSNLIPNNDFESGTSAQSSATFSTDIAYAGSKSLKMVGDGTTKTYYVLTNSDGATPRTVAAKGSDIYYCAAQVYCLGLTNSSYGGTISFIVQAISKTGAVTDVSGNASLNATNAFNNVWTLMAGNVAVPSDTVKVKFAIRLSVFTTGTFYVDQVIIREQTLAQNASDSAYSAGINALNAQTTASNAQSTASIANSTAITASGTATAAQNTANSATGAAAAAQSATDLRARDFSNLVAGSDFEGSAHPWTLGSNWSVASDLAHNGSKSLKHSAGAAAQCTAAATAAVVPGENFYLEFWVQRDSTYNGGATNSYFKLIDNATSTTISNTLLDASSLNTYGQWVKISKTVTIPSGVKSMSIVISADNSVGNIWFDDIVVRRVVTPDALADLNQDKIDNLPADIATTRSFFSEPRWIPSWAGGLADDVSIPASAVSSAIAGTLNRVYLLPITVTQNRVYTALKFGLSFSSVTVTNFYAALFSVDQSDGTATKVLDLGDIKSQLNNALTMQTVTIPGGGISVQAGELYYVALLQNGGTAAMNMTYATTTLIPNSMVSNRYPKYLSSYWTGGSPTSFSSITSIPAAQVAFTTGAVFWAALGTASPIVVPSKLQFSDGFTRANATTLGNSWVARYGNGLAVSSGNAVANATTTSSINTFVSKLNYTDQSVSAKFTRLDNVSAGGMALVLRGDGNGNFVYLRVYQSKAGLLSQVNTTARIYTSTSYSTPGSLFTGGTVRDSQNYSVNDGIIMPQTDTWTFTASGTTYTGYRNDTAVCSWTDSGGAFTVKTTSKEVGVGGLYSNTTSQIDDWVAYDL